jgi:ribonucleoside-diphosphate reductase alpha chain
MVSGHPNIKMATSIIDYVFRVLGLEYLGRTDLTQVPPELEEAAPEDHSTPGPEALSSGPVSETDPGSEPEPAMTRPARGQARSGNGSNGHASDSAVAVFESTATVSVMSAHLSEMMGDAPFCDVCGHITVRNGACYKCLNCGNSLGCS